MRCVLSDYKKEEKNSLNYYPTTHIDDDDDQFAPFPPSTTTFFFTLSLPLSLLNANELELCISRNSLLSVWVK
jgi:hypothetical protein